MGTPKGVDRVPAIALARRENYPCHFGSRTCPSEPLEIFPATVYFFRGDLVIDRSKTPITTVRCQITAPLAPSAFVRQQRAKPTRATPYHTTGDSNHSKSCRGTYTSAYGIRIAEFIGRVEWIYRGCVSMCIDAYYIHITCSIIDPTS